MKKSAFLAFCLATLLMGCTDDKDSADVCASDADCLHGTCNGGACECTGSYMLDDNSLCSACQDGYVSNGTSCIKNESACTKDADCGHGTCSAYSSTGSKLCACSEGYAMGSDKKCSACETGYTNNNGVCSKNGKPADSGNEGNNNQGNNNQGNPGTTECTMTFNYFNQYTSTASGGAAEFTVNFVGSFNDWNKSDSKYAMTPDGKGNHSITVKLQEGTTYSYKFHINGWENAETGQDDGWQNDPNNSNVDAEGNNTFTFTCGGGNGGNGGNGGGGGGSQTSVVPTENCYIKSVPQVQNKNISFEIECKDGTSSISEVTGGVSPQVDGLKVTDTVTENNKYAYIVKAGNNEVFVPVWVEDTPFDWHDAVLYFAFTDRFNNGDTSNDQPVTDASADNTSNARWLGGDFKGMTNVVKNGYFKALGVNTLWISSVSMNAQGTSQGTNGDEAHWYSAYHSYWPVSSFYTDANASEFTSQSTAGVSIKPIEPHFGTLDELKELINECHKQGIRVLIDFAANQVHKDSPVFKNHPNWFNDVNSPWLCDSNNGWDNYSEKCWFSQDLPDINYEVPEARKAMIDHVAWLVKTTNIDGFRVDAVKHMARQFIIDMRAKTDQIYNNSGSMFYMVGETFDGSIDKLNNFIGNDTLHAQFDFNLYFKLRDNVLNGSNLSAIKNAYDDAKRYNSDLMGTFMGNHDVARALSIAGGQNQNKWGANTEITDWMPYFKTKLALTIIMTNRGVPFIYYGDEYGQEGANDPDNRRMMKFDNFNDQQSMQLDFVKQLGQIRAQHAALRRGNREDLTSSDKAWCYKMSDGSESIIVALGTENGAGCDLKGSYNLQNLLNPDAPTLSGVSNITFDDNNKLSIFLVK